MDPHRLEACLNADQQIYYMIGLVARNMCLVWIASHTGQKTVFLNLRRPQVPRLAAPSVGEVSERQYCN
jgi:hypothetical protein